jgi:REP element-mobilizing transposase RayT
MLHDHIALFLTWCTYGTWLPGDQRGWVEYHQGWRLPDPILELECSARMTDDACRLTKDQRKSVEDQIAETCQIRGWHLHAVNCRSNHIHVVVGALDARPRKVRGDLKAWATRRLAERSLSSRAKWWAERGSVRCIFDEDSLEAAIVYTTDAQDRKTAGVPRVEPRG